jgi:hypothetical protein
MLGDWLVDHICTIDAELRRCASVGQKAGTLD